MFLSLIYASLTVHPSVYSPTFQLYSWTSRLFHGSGFSLPMCDQKNQAQVLWEMLVTKSWGSACHFLPSHWLTWVIWIPSQYERDWNVWGRKRKRALPHCPSHRVLPTAACATRERDDTAPACTWNGRWICTEPPFLFLLPECSPTCGPTSFNISSSPSSLPASLPASSLLFNLMVWACPIKLFLWTVTLEWNQNKTKDSSVWLSDCPSDWLTVFHLCVHLFSHLPITYLSVHPFHFIYSYIYPLDFSHIFVPTGHKHRQLLLLISTYSSSWAS